MGEVAARRRGTAEVRWRRRVAAADTAATAGVVVMDADRRGREPEQRGVMRHRTSFSTRRFTHEVLRCR